MELHAGILEKYGVEMIGAVWKRLRKARLATSLSSHDQDRFGCGTSATVNNLADALKAADELIEPHHYSSEFHTRRIGWRYRL